VRRDLDETVAGSEAFGVTNQRGPDALPLVFRGHRHLAHAHGAAALRREHEASERLLTEEAGQMVIIAFGDLLLFGQQEADRSAQDVVAELHGRGVGG
jgi:hypothetical protein